ncbi:MAG: coiled-coil domain-containing protein [Candidatus Helarchaeota archaeon]
MATVFERLEEKMEQIMRVLEKVMSSQEDTLKIIETMQKETNQLRAEMEQLQSSSTGEASIKYVSDESEKLEQRMAEYFNNFSDLMGSKIDELLEEFENLKKASLPSGKELPDISSFKKEVERSRDELKIVNDNLLSLQDGIGFISNSLNQMRREIASIKNIQVQAAKIEEPLVEAKPEEIPSIKDERIESKPTLVETIYKGAIRTAKPKKIGTEPESATPSPVVKQMYMETIKSLHEIKSVSPGSIKRKEVPQEVFDLLDSIKPKIQLPAQDLARFLEFIRDKIVKVFKFHPALYELGTFARKIKKYPVAAPLDDDIKNLLEDKITEWKKRISGYAI